VAQVRLDLNLAAELVLHVGLLQLRLEEHLRGKRAAFAPPAVVSCAPPRLAQRTADDHWSLPQQPTLSATMNLLSFSRAR
jgi:hypothetical protein